MNVIRKKKVTTPVMVFSLLSPGLNIPIKPSRPSFSKTLKTFFKKVLKG